MLRGPLFADLRDAWQELVRVVHEGCARCAHSVEIVHIVPDILNVIGIRLCRRSWVADVRFLCMLVLFSVLL